MNRREAFKLGNREIEEYIMSLLPPLLFERAPLTTLLVPKGFNKCYDLWADSVGAPSPSGYGLTLIEYKHYGVATPTDDIGHFALSPPTQEDK